MANDEHRAVLGRGVEVWNDWRDDRHRAAPDLSGAKLNGAILLNRAKHCRGSDVETAEITPTKPAGGFEVGEWGEL